jgi:hypothetical protein
MDASTSGDAGNVVRTVVRRVVDDCDDEDEVRKGGRRFKQAGTLNLHLVDSFPCLAGTQQWEPAFLPFSAGSSHSLGRAGLEAASQDSERAWSLEREER